MKKKTLNDYEIGNLFDLDFLKIFDILKDIKEQIKNCTLQNYRKSYVNSLFSPLCSYAIEYLNDNKEKRGIIGKSKVSGIDVIYIILNQAVYDLFFHRKKGQIFNDGKNLINYNISSEDENYLELKLDYDLEYDFEDLFKALDIDNDIKENSDDIKILKEVVNNKRKEIISSFRFGYTVQERIMNLINNHSDKKIKELPNVIFFEKNELKKSYIEVDRIITVESNATLSNFLVFLKTKFKKGKNLVSTKIFKEGKVLSLPQNSCNFIEIKASSKYFKEKEQKKEKKNKFFEYKSPSEISSDLKYEDNSQKFAIQITKKMNEFIELFNNINISYTQINLIIIIDSYFTKDFFEVAQKFSDNLKSLELLFDFNLYFVHIESDIVYISQSDNYKQLETLKINLKEKEKEFENLQKRDKDNEEEIKRLKTNINEFKNSLKDAQKQLYELQKKNRKRKIKKKLRNYVFGEWLDNIINSDSNLIEKDKGNNYIIGNYQNNAFKNIKKLNSNIAKYNILLDLQTFIRLDYNSKNMDLIDDIKSKHLSKIKLYSKKDINKLILIVDFVFILFIKNIIEQYFRDKEIIIKSLTVDSEDLEEKYLLFLLSLKNKAVPEDSLSIKLKDDIILYNEINIQEIHNINDFIDFFYELKSLKTQNNLEDFPIYDPKNEEGNLYVKIKQTDCKSEEILVLIVEPLSILDKKVLENYEKTYTYILYIHQACFFDFSENNGKIFSKYFFNNEKCMTFTISSEISIIYEKNNIFLSFFNQVNQLNAAIIEQGKENGLILFKFKLIRKNESDNIQEENYNFNANNIIDENIRIIMDNIKFINNKNYELLICEPYNIIHKYITSSYKNLKVVLISPEKNHDLKNKIATKVENEINIDIFSYFNNNKNKLFDSIILAYGPINELICDEKDKILIISSHLKKNGILCLSMFLKNKYLSKKIEKEMKAVFKEVSIFRNHSDYVFICNKNSE